MKAFITILSLFLLASAVLKATPPPAPQTPPGEGTIEEPYKVSSVKHLLWIAHRGTLTVNGTDYTQDERWSAVYEQQNSIDFPPDIADWHDGKGWLPIGIDVNNGFAGIYDGQENIITGLFINREDENNVGLFGHLGEGEGDEAEIRNVRLEDVNVTGARAVGSLVGRVTGDQNTLIIGCSATGVTGKRSVIGDAAVGGLVGSSNSFRTNPGNVEVNPLISRSWANIDVFFSDKSPGGAAEKFGGLAGCSQRGRIFDSYALGDVTVVPDQYNENVSKVGGLAGCILVWGQIQRSFSAGKVEVGGDVDDVGGLLGSFDVSQGSVVDSYWNTETSGQTSSAGDGVTGLNENEFGDPNEWDGFDFDADVWEWDADLGRPSLRDVPAITNIVWNGSADQHWTNTSNWEDNRNPKATDVVVIPSSGNDPVIDKGDGLQRVQRLIIEDGATLTLEPGAQLTVERGLTNENGPGGLVLQADETATASLLNNTIGLQATVEHYIPESTGTTWDDKTIPTEWFYISHPVAGIDIDGTVDGLDRYDLYRWHETDDTWLNHQGGNFGHTEFERGTGYIFAAPEVVELTYEGELHAGDQDWEDLTRQGEGTNNENNDGFDPGWHLVGNPFPSGIIAADTWTFENIVETPKVWNNQTQSYEDVPDGFIPAKTAFFVQVDDGFNEDNRLIIPPVARAHEAPGSDKTGLPDRILLEAKSEGSEMRQQHVIRLEPDATEGFDPRYDSRFMAGYAPELFSITETDRFSTIAISEISDDLVIPMGFRKNQEGENFFITLQGNIPGTELFLYDLKTDTWHELDYDKPYAFNAAENDDHLRFELHFSPPDNDPVSVNEAGDKHAADMWFHDGIVYVKTTETDTRLTIYDTNGRVLKTYQPESGLQSYRINLPPGVYFARLDGRHTRETLKIMTTRVP